MGNRMMFGGNLLRQPTFVQLRLDRPEALRVVGKMIGSGDDGQRTVPGDLPWVNPGDAKAGNQGGLPISCEFKKNRDPTDANRIRSGFY